MKNKSVWFVFFEGLKIFCLNIHKFLLYMSFPVLGQMLGLFVIFGLTYWFTGNYQNLIVKYPAFKDLSTMLMAVVVSVIPGLLLFTKALWDYLVAYVALNSMTEGYLNTGKVYDFRAHNEVATKKFFSFIAVWFLFGIFTFLSVIPIFWLFGGIFFVYFILIFQVFTFENGLSPIGYFKRSLTIIKGNFGKTFALMTLLILFTYYFLASGLSVIFDYFNWTEVLNNVFEKWAFTLPLDSVEKFGITPSIVAKNLVQSMIAYIVVGFTLPIRSICWTLWYNNLNVTEDIPKKTRKKSVKKESVKPAKTFKIEKREIDPEIIRRARLEDDEY